MSASISQFLTQIGNNAGIRTQNLFEMKAFLSKKTGDLMGGAANAFVANNNKGTPLTFYGQNFTLPTRTIDMNTVSFRAFDVPVPGKFSFTQEHSMTLNCDMNNTVRNAFLAWQAATINPDIDNGSGLWGDRALHLDDMIEIDLLGNDGGVVEYYLIKGVRIKEVGGLTVSNTDAGVSTFDVTFSSVYWTHGPMGTHENQTPFLDKFAYEKISSWQTDTTTGNVGAGGNSGSGSGNSGGQTPNGRGH